VHPAGGGITTARDLARFYAMLSGGGFLDGTRLLQPETVAEVTALQVDGLDHSLGQHKRRSLGLVLDDPRMGVVENSGSGSFGHGGQATSVGWADPRLGLAVAYITNGARSEDTNLHLPEGTGGVPVTLTHQPILHRRCPALRITSVARLQ
jgi:CubicO group peptidase (beta-lactamase class C family)